MAFVHPSRMALVPKEPASARSSGSRDYRGPYLDRDDERRREHGRARSGDREVRRDEDGRESRHHSNGDRHHDDRRDEDIENGGSRRERSWRDDRPSGRSPLPPSKSLSGRASPRYDDYSRRDSTPPPPPPPPPPRDDRYRRTDTPSENGPPWRQQENMYRRDSRVDAGGDYFERRRQQRVNNTFSIWPPSPRAPARKLPQERDLESRKKHKRARSTSVSSSSTDSEEDRRRRERKEHKRARKEKDKRGRRHQRSHTDSDDEPREHRRDRRKRSRSVNREDRKTRSRTRSPRRIQSSDEDDWVEKPAPSGSFVPAVPTTIPVPNVPSPSTTRTAQKDAIDDDVSDEELGPQPALVPSTTKKLDERAYGGALLRGEGSAMAAFLQDGTDVRIPRRGEIGLTSDEIGKFESVGYVMSGSRHRRMNAVRMRKENQVISAEEKRGILKLQQEEKQRREAILREEFQELLTDRLKGTEGAKASS
ncbi:ras-induced vulval development antagonist-domain-containing protein [Russula earlei]|uniref:Ras-induced vulval development antagonist-domain-containing protein n=1 Tax=Russula earlei TaxID=71964 RepID=A0ACC0UF05_9AGAM|nr:ras-induced vulval development antagonist-domain-containing protein [Russula earlei]